MRCYIYIKRCSDIERFRHIKRHNNSSYDLFIIDSIKEELNTLGYTISYNPEFIAQGTILKNQAYPDMVLIGEGSESAGDLLQQIYENHTANTPRICRMSPLEAEITKISLNCFLTTK